MNRSVLKKTRALALAGMIATLYVVLTYLAMAFGLDKNAIQVRFSEALCTMAVLTPSAIPGLTIGCLLANILTGCAALDIALGPVATLLGAIGAYLIGKLYRRSKKQWILYLSPLPTVLANTVVVPIVVYVCYTAPEMQSVAFILYSALTVFIGEIISAYLLGMMLYLAVEKRQKYII